MREAGRRCRAGWIAALAFALSGCALFDDADAGPGGREPLWTVELATDQGRPRHAAVAKDVVLVRTGKAVLAYHAADGVPRWSLPLPERTRDVATDGAVVVAAGEQEVVGYDLRSGRKRVRLPIAEQAYGSDVRVTTASETLLVSVCTTDRQRPACRLIARDLRTGKDLGTPALPEAAYVAFPARHETHAPTTWAQQMRMDRPTLVLAETSIDIHHPAKAREWRVIDTGTREVVAVHRHDAASTPALADVEVHYAGEVAVLADRDHDGRVWAYNLRSGARLWGPEPPGELERPNFASATTPMLHDGLLLAQGWDGPQAVDPATGKARWRERGRAQPIGVHRGTVVVHVQRGKPDEQLHGIAMANGARRWTYHGSPRDVAVVAGRVVFTDRNRDSFTEQVVVLGAAGGETLWRTQPGELLGAGADWIVTDSDSGEGEGPHALSLYTGP